MSVKGTLLLLPNLLDENADHRNFLPKTVDEAVFNLQGLIAESEKSARAFLKRFAFSEGRTFRDIPLRLLNEHTNPSEYPALIVPLSQGERWGLISDCGLPCFADPGSQLVALAHEKGIAVEAFMGPSSIILALLLSGFSAQSFCFHGYLPQDKMALEQKLKTLEENSAKNKSTQLFIEAPYRNDRLLEVLLKSLKTSTKLCLAVDLTLPSQEVIVKTVQEWKAFPKTIGKRPAIFLFHA